MEQTLSKQVTPTDVHMHVYTSAKIITVHIIIILCLLNVPQPSLVVTHHYNTYG